MQKVEALVERIRHGLKNELIMQTEKVRLKETYGAANLVILELFMADLTKAQRRKIALCGQEKPG